MQVPQLSPEKANDIIALERTWKGVINALECSQKRRIASMRAKLAQVIESNSKNTDAGNGQLEKVLFSNETFLGSNKNSESMEKVFKTAFSMD